MRSIRSPPSEARRALADVASDAEGPDIALIAGSTLSHRNLMIDSKSAVRRSPSAELAPEVIPPEYFEPDLGGNIASALGLELFPCLIESLLNMMAMPPKIDIQIWLHRGLRKGLVAKDIGSEIAHDIIPLPLLDDPLIEIHGAPLQGMGHSGRLLYVEIF